MILWRLCSKNTRPVRLIPALSERPGAYGPGHCSFLRSADGTADYIVYHANVKSGTGWNGRTIRVQSFVWVCGFPVFGRLFCRAKQYL